MIYITIAGNIPRIQLIIIILIELIAAIHQSISIYRIGVLLLAKIKLGIITFCVLVISPLDPLIRLCFHLKKIIRTCFFVFNVIFELFVHFCVNLIN